MDANLRLHIKGGSLRNFLQTKHGLSNEVWNAINVRAFVASHLKNHPHRLTTQHTSANLFTTVYH